jgi:uncharacterized repeat protein (TIGR03803 family)
MRSDSKLCAVLTFAALAALAVVAPNLAFPQAGGVLYNFCSQTNCTDGANPNGSLLLYQGNLYGTTQNGGANGDGTVFELSSNNGSWTENVLYSFCTLSNCADGSNPNFATLTSDNSGNLYGTASGGGANGYGVVFQLVPPQPGGSWTENVLYSFCQLSNCADGASPLNNLLLQNGNIFGTYCYNYTAQNEYIMGVFELSETNNIWSSASIYSSNIGGCSQGGVNADSKGNLYSTASGWIFELSNNNGSWTSNILHTFPTGPDDGLYPEDAPVIDAEGNVYGTTLSGGKTDNGAVYKLIPGKGKNAGTWTSTIIWSLNLNPNKRDGNYPTAGVVLDSSGNLYGNANGWGFNEFAGDVYKLSRVNNTRYTEQIFQIFDGTDGNGSGNTVILDSLDNIYGMSNSGGANGAGEIFEISSPVTPTTSSVSSNYPPPGSAPANQAITFTAVVSPAPPPGETVTFEDSTLDGSAVTLLGTGTLSPGQNNTAVATYTAPAGQVRTGTSSITAVYTGDFNYGASTGVVHQSVARP